MWKCCYSNTKLFLCFVILQDVSSLASTLENSSFQVKTLLQITDIHVTYCIYLFFFFFVFMYHWLNFCLYMVFYYKLLKKNKTKKSKTSWIQYCNTFSLNIFERFSVKLLTEHLVLTSLHWKQMQVYISWSEKAVILEEITWLVNCQYMSALNLISTAKHCMSESETS